MPCPRRHECRLAQDGSLWYHVFQDNYPVWGRQVKYAARSLPQVNWVDFVTHIARQNKRAQSFSFEFVADESSLEFARAERQRKLPRKRKLVERDPPAPLDEGLRPSSSSPACKNTRRERPLSPHLSTSTPVASTHASTSSSSSSASTSASAASSSSSSSASTSTPAPALPPSTTNSTATTNQPAAHPENNAAAATARWRDIRTLLTRRLAVLEQVELRAADDNARNRGELPPHRNLARLANLYEDPGFEWRSAQYPPPFRIQDPLVVDIDRVTKQGIVATGKHRKEAAYGSGILPSLQSQRSEHKILFWEYPSWRLVREFDLNFAPADTSCQITGIQTIQMPTETGTTKIRFFSLAVGQALFGNNPDDADADERVDLWQTVLIYRLYDNGATQCVAHVSMDGELLGREVFFFSEASWDVPRGKGPYRESVKDWMKIIAPAYADYDPQYTAFMLALGPKYPDGDGCGQLVRFDIRGEDNILDPAAEPVVWDSMLRQFRSISPFNLFSYDHMNTMAVIDRPTGPPAVVVARIPLGERVSCMIHFRYPQELNHLVCTGSYRTDELTVYDWRFGVKVGVLPWRLRSSVDQNSYNAADNTQRQRRLDDELRAAADAITREMQTDDLEDADMDDLDEDEQTIVRPWGLESTMVLPPTWSSTTGQGDNSVDMGQRGFRLIAVGDNRDDKLEIKVWDISYLFNVVWRPLEGLEEETAKRRSSEDPELETPEDRELALRFPWWYQATPQLRQMARRMYEIPLDGDDQSALPYSPPDGECSMILVHTFDKSNTSENLMPVKYTAYNVLRTSLFLLTEDGSITVLDIETGQVIGTVDNVAAVPGIIGPQRQVRGIDVNVVGGTDIVVTSRQGILRGTLTS